MRKTYIRLIETICLSGIAITFALGNIYAQALSFTSVVEDEDPSDLIYSFSLGEDSTLYQSYPVENITDKNRATVNIVRKKEASLSAKNRKKLVLIHSELEEIIKVSPEKKVTVVVTLDEDIDFPLFPAFDNKDLRYSRSWQATFEKRHALMNEIKTIRKVNHRKFADEFSALGGKLEVEHNFTMANAFLATLEARDASLFSRLKGVLHVRLAGRKLFPLNDGNPNNDMDVARMSMHLNSDYFQFSPNVPQGFAHFLGVIDTGIYSEHTLFDEQFGETIFAWDCVEGDDACDDNGSMNWDPEDCASGGGHGTPVASIIQGNDSLGFQYQGASSFGIDSYKASTGCEMFVDVAFSDEHIDKALQAAILFGDEVVNLSLGANVSVPDGITAEQDLSALAVDNTYNAGLVVVAASGNNVVLDCPSCAHKALAIGAYDVQTPFLLDPTSGRGPATDGRIKPDVIAPTCVETASNDGPSEVSEFCGTSASAPMASAAAMLTRSAFENNVPNIDVEEAGYVYAAMHMFGRNMGSIANDMGSGPVNMRGCGRFWFGKTDINVTGDTVNIPMTLTPPFGTGKIKAAIWWPEAANQDHNDIDLALLNPSSYVVDESEEADSVFERVSSSGIVPSSGTWQLQITGFDIQSGPQEVYFAASAGGCIQNFIEAP